MLFLIHPQESFSELMVIGGQYVIRALLQSVGIKGDILEDKEGTVEIEGAFVGYIPGVLNAHRWQCLVNNNTRFSFEVLELSDPRSVQIRVQFGLNNIDGR